MDFVLSLWYLNMDSEERTLRNLKSRVCGGGLGLRLVFLVKAGRMSGKAFLKPLLGRSVGGGS